MKNANLRRFVASASALVVCLLLAACGSAGSSNSNPTPTPTPGKVTVTCPTQVQVGVNAPATYTCTASEAVTWTSSDTALATIASSGVITPTSDTVTSGKSVTITATPVSGNDTAGTATVQVVDLILYTRIARNPTTYVVDSVIWAINPDGTGNVSILDNNLYRPTWKADHAWFAAESNAGTHPVFYKITTQGAQNDGKAASTCTLNQLGQANGFAPSPDGTKIAFLGEDYTTRVFGIYTMNPDCSNLTALYQDPYTGANAGPSQPLISLPRWSPDGKKIVFVESTNSAFDYEVWTMNADGSGQELITTNGGQNPSYLNQGTIVYDSSACGGICTIPATGGTPTLIKAGGWSPVASPSGKWVTYTAGDGIHAMMADGSHDQLLDAAGSYPSW